MDCESLKSLINDDESDRVEFTVSWSKDRKLREAICAFANDLAGHGAPGYLIIGYDQKARRFSGTRIDDALLQTLGGLRDDGAILPRPTLTVEKVVCGEGEVAVVTVQPSQLPPVKYDGRVCVRVGPRRGYATPEEERRLIERRISHALTFDAEPCFDAAIEDLSLRLFTLDYRQRAIAADVIDENHRPIEQQLAALGFYDLRVGCPTNAGVIVFGQDPRRHLAGAYVQFLRVDGTGLADEIVNDRVIAGDLLSVLRELDTVIDAHVTQMPVVETALREANVVSYPVRALRELTMNAVMHRDYASTAPVRVTWFNDRVEVQNAGGLYGGVTRENFGATVSYRNPVIATAMKELGYVNRYGRGVAAAREALKKNGSREPEFQFDAGHVLVKVFSR